MLFNSLQFAIFFIAVYSLYIILNHRWQNRMLLATSYIFYGAWDWRFLSLIFASTILDYICGLEIYKSENLKKRRFFLSLSVFGNLLILGFFKYFNFFASNLQHLLQILGISIHPIFLHIVLPIGISFYTFQTMSYSIDIYRREIAPTRKFLDFALFVAFFPQLVAGPIERAKHLLPQILSPRKLTLQHFYDGCYLIFWGLFQKMFIADNLALLVDPIFSAPPPYNGTKVILASYAFAFQIFCDFAGYSNIARGLGKCMGFDIMINFKLPYFSSNPRQFWQRWHISLSTWLRDYLYIPLGGNKKDKMLTYRNLAFTMLLGGLWHGASWTFVLWGFYHGVLLITHRMAEPFLRVIPSPKNIFAEKAWLILRVIFFFHLVCLGWLIFRAESLTQIIEMLRAITFNFFPTPDAGINQAISSLLFFLWLLLAVQIFQLLKNKLIFIRKSSIIIKAFFYYVCFYLITFYGVYGAKEFIYFQF